ncbi:MAG: type I phosphomannose isomerase catalytic subunit [Verrucomicrobiota bacterium]
MSAITFHPLYIQRIWGGRKLETMYQRELPDPTAAFGEAWEIVDREGAQSIVNEGAYVGKSLHDLWKNHRSEIFGDHLPDSEHFPILIKILDCSASLSIQVHPPATIAKQLGSEPKTEMWFIADALPGAKLHVGLKRGATREKFQRAIADGTVAELVHAIVPKTGDSLFIESGRLHAIGAGFLIHEIQQNSDTTYRVFDWNRLDSNGQARDLHVEQSLDCIDFDDIEPQPERPNGNTLAACSHFLTTLHHLKEGEVIANPQADRFSLITVISGSLNQIYIKGQTILLPKSALPLIATESTSVLQITIPA